MFTLHIDEYLDATPFSTEGETVSCMGRIQRIYTGPGSNSALPYISSQMSSRDVALSHGCYPTLKENKVVHLW